MKALFIGKDQNTAGRMAAMRKSGAEIIELAATDSAAILPAKADFAVISTGCAGHVLDLVKACHSAGTGIFLAQPFSAGQEEAEAVETALAGYEKPVVCGQPARFVAAYRDLRKMVQAGKLGTIGTIRIGRLRPRNAPPQAMAVGMLSALEWMFGEIEHLYAQAAPGQLDYHIVVARMKSGAIAHLEFGHTELVPYHYFEVTGTGGLVEFDSRFEPEMRVTDFSKGLMKDMELLPQVLWDDEMAAFTAAVKGEPSDAVLLRDGLRACTLNRACVQSETTNTVVLI